MLLTLIDPIFLYTLFNQIDIADPNWIQAGELGIAFVSVLALLIFIRDVMNKSAAREERLMVFIDDIQPTLNSMLSTQKQILHRLGEVEKEVRIDRRKSKKKRGDW